MEFLKWYTLPWNLSADTLRPSWISEVGLSVLQLTGLSPEAACRFWEVAADVLRDRLFQPPSVCPSGSVRGCYPSSLVWRVGHGTGYTLNLHCLWFSWMSGGGGTLSPRFFPCTFCWWLRHLLQVQISSCLLDALTASSFPSPNMVRQFSDRPPKLGQVACGITPLFFQTIC